MKRTAGAAIILALAAFVPLAHGQQPPNTPTSITLGASPSPLVFGRSTVLSGKLMSATPANQNVSLRSDPFPFDRFANAASVVTNATGDFAFIQRPEVNTRFQARRRRVESPIVTVLVRPAVSLRLSDRTPKRGQRVRFAGQVCPQHDGASLSIQRRYRTGYRTVRRTTLKDIAGSTCSSYRRTFRVYRDGRFRAVIGGHPDHATGLSRPRVADAHG